MAAVGLPIWAVAVWADTVWAPGVWREPGGGGGGTYTAIASRKVLSMQTVIDSRGKIKSIDYEAITVAGVSIGLNPVKVNGTWGARILLETAPIRYLTHGGTPTAIYGIPLAASEEILVIGEDMLALRMIKLGDTSAVAHVTYLRNEIERL